MVEKVCERPTLILQTVRQCGSGLASIKYKNLIFAPWNHLRSQRHLAVTFFPTGSILQTKAAQSFEDYKTKK